MSAVRRRTKRKTDMRRALRSVRVWAILAAVLPPIVVASVADAQGLPPGSAATPATSGSSDVTSTGFQLFDKKDLKEKNATELVFSGGGIESGGNTRVLALTT